MRRRASRRVLVIGYSIPGADSSAGERRVIQMAAMLGERAAVDIVATGRSRPDDERSRVRALRLVGAVHVPFGAAPVHLARVLRGARYRLILVESWDIAAVALPLVRCYQPEAVFAVDSIDLHFLRDARRVEVMGAPDPDHERRMTRELDTYLGADIRVFVSDVERKLYESLPGSRTDHNVVIPIIVERPSGPRVPRPGEVAFVGGLWHNPNLDGVSWFCSDVWPSIRAGVPDARLRLIGSNAWSLPIDTAALADCPGVTVEGFVADLNAVYAEICVVVAPLRFGAGMKGKVCEAMAAGAPVVTTSVGVEGIEAQPGRDLLVADDPGPFARAVVSLLDDDARAAAVGAAGAAAIHAQCGVEVVRAEVHRLLQDYRPHPEAAGEASARPLTREGRSGHLLRQAAAAGWRLGRRLQALRQRVGS